MKILAIDTSCDETAVAITEGRKVLSNVIYSQILIHKKWGGVVPSLAKRAHEERIDLVIKEALTKYSITNYQLSKEKKRKQDIWNGIDAIAVTQGPGLAIALEVGIKKAKELARQFHKKLIAINHLEGHIYSSFVENSKGNPEKNFHFPYLAIIISGGHTSIVYWKNHLEYEVIGETIDDAAGEALDKAAKILNLGYPGGPIIERLARIALHKDDYHFPRPMTKQEGLNFSFSGLKTSFYYFLKKMDEKEKMVKLNALASSFQEAVFDTILLKTERAIKKTGVSRLCVGGGVIANAYLRQRFRNLVKKYKGVIEFPPFAYLTGDNASMIGVAGYYRAKKNNVVKNIDLLDRIPRMQII